MGADGIVGFSSHNVAQLCAAGGEPVDYVALGPIFSNRLQTESGRVTGIRRDTPLPARSSKSRWLPSAASRWKTHLTSTRPAPIRWP